MTKNEILRKIDKTETGYMLERSHDTPDCKMYIFYKVVGNEIIRIDVSKKDLTGMSEILENYKPRGRSE